jgi:PAS domain S-box-containing protein
MDNNDDKTKQTIDFLLERLEAERNKYQEAKKMTEELISSIGEGIVISDEYGDITNVNQVALDLLGYTPDELIGHWLPKVLPSMDKDGNPVSTTERPAARALLTGRPVTSVISYPRKDGTIFPTANTAAPFMFNGVPKGVIIVFRDLTREIQIEKSKDEFISLTSHQLSTPLTAVQLFTKLLQDSEEELSPTQRKYLDKIEISVNRMLQLVHDFLNISRLELGVLKPNYSPVEVNELAENLLQETNEAAKTKGVKVSYSSSIEQPVACDSELLAQILHNLLTNAIRYSPPKTGKVVLGTMLRNNHLMISVRDNGIGIPESAKEKIYTRLFRAENAEKVESSGTGLGLYLVKKIVESMNGKTWFESEEKKGTTFFVDLPVPHQKNVSKVTAKVN